MLPTNRALRLGGAATGGSLAGCNDRSGETDTPRQGDRTVARQVVTDVVADLGERRFDGDRFEFEPYVESVESAERAAPKLREIFREGITVYGDERLDPVRKAVFADE